MKRFVCIKIPFTYTYWLKLSEAAKTDPHVKIQVEITLVYNSCLIFQSSQKKNKHILMRSNRETGQL